MITRYRDAATKEDITGAFSRFVPSLNDTIKYPANFLKNATLQELSDLGIETYEYIPPAPPAASTDPNDYPLLPFQFYALLEILGKTDAVNTAIDSISDTTERAIARAKFAHSLSFDRSDPLFTSLAPVVGLTDEAIDTAWMQAKDIT